MNQHELGLVEVGQGSGGMTLVKRHSLTQLKLPKKSSGAEFCTKFIFCFHLKL